MRLSSKKAYSNDFWRSCDTEDWSNDAENLALHHRSKIYFKYSEIENSYFKLYFFHNITVFSVFLMKWIQINKKL